jgi:hypothetical protein
MKGIREETRRFEELIGDPAAAALDPQATLTEFSEIAYVLDLSAGTVLTLDGAQLEGVTVSIGEETTTTDVTGRFALTDVPAGNLVTAWARNSAGWRY